MTKFVCAFVDEGLNSGRKRDERVGKTRHEKVKEWMMSGESRGISKDWSKSRHRASKRETDRCSNAAWIAW